MGINKKRGIQDRALNTGTTGAVTSTPTTMHRVSLYTSGIASRKVERIAKITIILFREEKEGTRPILSRPRKIRSREKKPVERKMDGHEMMEGRERMVGRGRMTKMGNETSVRRSISINTGSVIEVSILT